MTECTRCGAPAQQFLCPRCVSRARATLRGLPRLLRHLREAAVGQTRLGDIGRHTPYRSRHELDGEALVTSQIEPLPPRDENGNTCNDPDEDDDDPADLYESRLARQQSALRKLLAAGGVNERASTLHTDIVNTLSTWIGDLAEMHNLDARTVPEGFIGPLLPGWRRLDTAMLGGPADMCVWLAHHIEHVANCPAADEFCDELDERVRTTLRIINRPKPPVPIGPCTAPDPDGQPGHCGQQITTFGNATHVSCPRCDTVHDVNELARENLDATDELWCTKDELMFILATMGTPITDARFRKWRHRKTIQERLLPDGTPQYHLGDARKAAGRATVSQNQRAVAMPETCNRQPGRQP